MLVRLALAASLVLRNGYKLAVPYGPDEKSRETVATCARMHVFKLKLLKQLRSSCFRPTPNWKLGVNEIVRDWREAGMPVIRGNAQAGVSAYTTSTMGISECGRAASPEVQHPNSTRDIVWPASDSSRDLCGPL
jgi:hypothetical protein